jgi:hypothetical protein
MRGRKPAAPTAEQALILGLFWLLFEATTYFLWLGLDQHWAVIVLAMGLIGLHGLSFIGFLIRCRTRVGFVSPPKTPQLRALDAFYYVWRPAMAAAAWYGGEPVVAVLIVVVTVMEFVAQRVNALWIKRAQADKS